MALIDKETIRSVLSFRYPTPEQPADGLNEAARHVWESWNGGTMDDVRRDMNALGNVLNARKEQSVEGLEEEYIRFIGTDHHKYQDLIGNGGIDLARHFAEWGAEHLKR